MHTLGGCHTGRQLRIRQEAYTPVAHNQHNLVSMFLISRAPFSYSFKLEASGHDEATVAVLCTAPPQTDAGKPTGKLSSEPTDQSASYAMA